MSETPRPRKRDRLKAVFRNRLDRSVSPASSLDPASQPTSPPSVPQEYRRSDSQHRGVLTPTATLDPSINGDDNGNDKVQMVRAFAQDSLWEDALSRLEQSPSTEDRSHARALREFAQAQKISPSTQYGSVSSGSNDLIENVKREAELKRVEAEQKAWRVKVGRRTIILRDVMARIIDCLDKFKEIGDLAVQYDPVHAALPWAAFRLLLQAATMNKEQAGQLWTGIDAATQAYLRARIYQVLYLGLPGRQDVADALKNSILELLGAICGFLGLAVKYFSSGSVANTTRGLLNPESLARCIGRIAETEMQVEKNALACKAILDAVAHQRQGLRHDKLIDMLEAHTYRFDSLQGGLANVEAGIGLLMEALSDEEVHNIFLWISGIPYESDLYNARRGRLEGTCEWLIVHETYGQWKASSESTTLWLHGIPGAGKTKLSTKVVDDVTPMDIPLAYFFCDRNQENRRDPWAVLHSITRQLSRVPGPQRIQRCTVDAYNKKKEQSFASNNLTNEETRELLLELANENPRSIIIIDGLDECDEGSRKCILDTLDHLVQYSSSVVKVFVASRNDKDLIKHYSSSPNLEIEAAHNQDDIEKLVMDRISQSQWATEEMSAHVRDAVVRLFREKSQGMFQWASLHIDELLEFESNQAILDWLHSLPEGLKAAYDRIYNGLGAKWRMYADRAFMWLMAISLKRITPELLCVLVCQDASKEFDFDATLSSDSLLSACRNLIKVDDNKKFDNSDGDSSDGDSSDDSYVDIYDPDDDEASKTCRFAHLSVQEYLETNHLRRVEADRTTLEISIKLWQRVSTMDDQKEKNREDRLSIKTQNYKHLKRLTTIPIEGFLAFADMSQVNQGIWDQLLQSKDGHDVVLGSPLWRNLHEYVIQYTRDKVIKGHLSMREDEMRAIMTPIGCCALLGNQVPVKFWIENGIFSPKVDYETARELLLRVYIRGETAICDLLLDAGTNFKGESSESLERRLRQLFRPEEEFKKDSSSTLIRLMNRLFDDGAPTNFCPSDRDVYDGTYPLEVARILLERGGDPNVHDDKKTTPLMHAANCGDDNIEMTKLLLQYGAEVNSMDEDDDTPLHLVAYVDRNIETLRLLLDSGADPNLGGAAECPPLQDLAYHSDVEAVKLLLNSNARVNDISRDFGTALHAAALCGSRGKDVYDLLLQHGADSGIELDSRGACNAMKGMIGSKRISIKQMYTAEQILQIALEKETVH
ncbi:hypothetical protein PFICI_04989 [Pestalotiopsis fici W106-1]|uniref:Uncharacterized protein n=1 Tax=Pestalotiopsis fici (strain W106-1 / CGMCC3.15140) TaxID=1229662 RepID=W3XAJ0_PESFW|nr:uncharacterized protein PFICI_04989 [Pestalotiopsis fici W106-1]ETS83113.1 hypothetical protein PFICI_04989 [Pestalotiopsis fici W106-1]